MFHKWKMLHVLKASGERLLGIKSLRKTIFRQQLWFPSQKRPLLHTAAGVMVEGFRVRVQVWAAGNLKQVSQTAGLMRPHYKSTTNISTSSTHNLDSPTPPTPPRITTTCLKPKDVANVLQQFLWYEKNKVHLLHLKPVEFPAGVVVDKNNRQ